MRMFKTTPVTEPAPDESSHLEPLVPLSVFQLDHPQPAEGWADFLGRRAIAFVPDDLGRDCVRRQDARRLLDEQRANQLRAAKRRQLAEAEAVEQDQRRRAQIWTGIPALSFPAGLSASSAMLAAAKDSQPRRESVLQHALANTGDMEYHSYQTSPEDAA
jgi:hypothetical protein